LQIVGTEIWEIIQSYSTHPDVSYTRTGSSRASTEEAAWNKKEQEYERRIKDLEDKNQRLEDEVINIRTSLGETMAASELSQGLLAESDANITQLQAEKWTTQQQSTTAQQQIIQLTSDLKEEKKGHAKTKVVLGRWLVLGKIGLAARYRWWEVSKRKWIDGNITILWGNPDRATIDAGNAAVHEGNFVADEAMISLGLHPPNTAFDGFKKQIITHFKLCSILMSFTYCTKVKDMFSLRGTLNYCHSWAAHSYDKTLGAKFDVLDKQWKELVAGITEFTRPQGQGFCREPCSRQRKA
jgi:hypothetical protein